MFLDIAHKNGRWQVLVKFAGQDLTLALDTEGDLFDPYAGTPSAQPQAIVRWTGSKFELEAVTSDGLHASGLVVAGGTRTGLGNGNTFKVSSLVASTHIERDTPAPASEGEARTIAIERGAQLKERLPIRKSPSSMGDSPAKVTLHFQSSGSMPGAAEPVVMRGGSVTLGRGDENDVLLLDPDRMVSKNHCVIEEHYGDVIVLDLSSNGTFLNYGEIPLGKKQTKLNSGDILSIGPYELLVEMPLVRADPIADPPQKKELLPAAWYRTLIREA